MPEQQTTDWRLPATRAALVRLRAEVVRLAHEVEALKGGQDIARRLRDAAMHPEMMEASK
ncbi:hypothetical protein [Falsiroseomonas sp. CW058]|uniref:hypothetical protein n=1 Tax=Falsiroseomonas sp. CW058 TaxID=3388664 RepID=UPI003D3240C5